MLTRYVTIGLFILTSACSIEGYYKSKLMKMEDTLKAMYKVDPSCIRESAILDLDREAYKYAKRLKKQNTNILNKFMPGTRKLRQAIASFRQKVKLSKMKGKKCKRKKGDPALFFLMYPNETGLMFSM